MKENRDNRILKTEVCVKFVKNELKKRAWIEHTNRGVKWEMRQRKIVFFFINL